MKTTRILLLSLALMLLAAPAAVAANRGIVGVNGQVGKLRLDRSTEDDIRRVEGEPDDVADFTADNDPSLRIRSLFYSCGTRCGTSYYLNLNAGGVLANFASSNRAFRSRRGTRAGMSQRRAERIERRRARHGCTDGIFYGGRGRRPFLVIAIDRIPGGRVTHLALHSGRNNVLDC